MFSSKIVRIACGNGYKITLRRPNSTPSTEYAPDPNIAVDTHNISITILTMHGHDGIETR